MQRNTQRLQRYSTLFLSQIALEKIRRTKGKSDGRLMEMVCRPISSHSHQLPVQNGLEFDSQRLAIEWLKRKLPNWTNSLMNRWSFIQQNNSQLHKQWINHKLNGYSGCGSTLVRWAVQLRVIGRRSNHSLSISLPFSFPLMSSFFLIDRDSFLFFFSRNGLIQWIISSSRHSYHSISSICKAIKISSFFHSFFPHPSSSLLHHMYTPSSLPSQS